MFRLLELRYWDQQRQDVDVCDDLDLFLEVSKSYHNRRKSRAGAALENQFQALLVANKIGFTRGGRTEGRRKPDFLFPSEQHYHDAGFPTEALTVLGAKTSCKERWRQVLAEAARVTGKHLITLDPAVSQDQTNQMREESLQLVVPEELHSSYTDTQRDWLMTVNDFIQVVRARQVKYLG